MRKLFAFVIPAVVAFAGLTAQGQSAETADLTPDLTADLTAVERWQADPTTVFEASEVSLDDFLWIARPVIVFANTPADPAFRDQMALLSERLDVLAERDIVLITDTNPAAASDIRRKLRPRGFMLALLGKDGQVNLRKPLPWNVRELTRVVDKMPMRQRETRETELGG